jgi:chemotaxis protein histidine kinase CheA
MAIETAVKIDIEVTGDGTVKQAANLYEDLGDAVSKTQLRAEELARQFGINDKRTQEAIKLAGQYKGELEQLDFAIDAAKGGSDQLFRASQGLVGGFEAAAGTMALFGGESEELEAILLKVQGAMALSQGLKDLNEFLPAIKNISKAFTGVLTKAVQGFSKASKIALASTGIGALIVGVGLLIEYWDDLKGVLGDVDEEQKLLNESQEEYNKAIAETTKEVKDVGIAFDLAKQGVISKEEALYQYNETLGDVLGAANSIEEAEANYVAKTDAYIKATALRRQADVLLEKAAQAQADILAEQATMQVDTNSKIGKSINARIEQIKKERAEQATLFTEYAANLVKEATEIETTNGIKSKSNENFRKKQAEDRKKNQEAEKKAADDKEAREKKAAEAEQKRIDDFNNKVAEQVALQEYLAQIDEENRQNRIDALNKQVEEEVALQEYLAQIDEENKQKEIEREKAVQDVKNAIYDESVKLADAIIGLAGESSKVGKAIALAQIGADTARALSGALANANSPTPDNVATGGLAGIAKYIALATTILSNAKRAYNIIKAPAPTTGSPSTPSAPGVPQMAAPRLGGVINSENELTQMRKVYVVESDITSTQAKVSNTQKVSLVE